MRKIASILAAFLFAACSTTDVADNEMKTGFKNPGNKARPKAYWNWLNGDIRQESLTEDLEEAKDKGLGGLQMWDTEAMRNPGGFVPSGPPFMGEESVKKMHHALKEAQRLDLDLGLITSSGWNAGGPWVPPEMASKNLYSSSIVIGDNGRDIHELPFPEVPARCPVGEDGLPRWYIDVAVLAWPFSEENKISGIDKIINLSSNYKNGELKWQAPEGKWQVMRYVCTNNGQQLIAASPNSKGPFIDFLDPEATRFHFQYILDKLGIKKGGDPEVPLKTLDVDSMELHEGIQWTNRFGEWFMNQHNYDPISWLPVLSGWIIGNDDISKRFEYDYKKTVSDLLIFSHYTTGSEICAEYGLQLAGEAGGPGPPIWNSCPVDALKALGNVDIPRGEFWVRNNYDIFLVKEIASASHIYAKPLVDAESWTTWWRWMDSPFVRKQYVDRAFCEGLNHITYHGYSNSPKEFGFPGRSYHAGVDMNPRVVWWSKARPFMDYLSRCCFMLQQGLFVADVAYYYGDEAPNFWPKFASVPDKPRLDGLGRGYDYDVVNTDVILNRMSVKNGRIVLPDGLSYKVLVLPERDIMPLEVLQKLEEMVSAGATIIGPRPNDVPGMTDYEARSKDLRILADKMWGSCDGNAIKEISYGKGTIVWGYTPDEWFEKVSVYPDFFCPLKGDQQNLDYIHRQTRKEDIYFVRNTSMKEINVDCVFRSKSSNPQFWDPVDGSIKSVHYLKETEAGTMVGLNLAPGGSIFVVFGYDGSPDYDSFESWYNGDFEVVNGRGKSRTIKIADIQKPISIEGAWKVSFNPEWGAPAEVVLDELISWTDHENEGVKFYSGAGMYSKTIQIDDSWLVSGKKIFIDLGDVRDVTEIFVNGNSAGILWKPPYRADITDLVHDGQNELKIEVMNMWINRLAGDKDLPAEERFTRTNILSHGYMAWPSDFEIQPAGLLGPVKLVQAAVEEVE